MALVLRKIERPVRAQVPGAGKKKQSNLLPQYLGKTPPCQDACPSAEDIRGFLTAIAQADEYGRSPEMAMKKAWETLTDKNPMPSIMGRVCPHPCESACNRGERDQPININRVEMSIGDFGIENKLELVKLSEENSGKKIAVVGSGPAGISAAYQLARRGHKVTVYEAHSEAGGMLRWGIPAYRLPRDIIQAEYQRVWDLGVEFKPNSQVGKDVALDDLKKNNDAVYFAIGAQRGRALPLDGSDSENVTTGVDFLLDHNLGKVTDLPKKILVIGGGDVAYDVARTSARMGADVTMVCRETRELMPATEEEIHHGEQEGITLNPGNTPKRLIVESGKVTGVEFLQVELGEKDENGWHSINEVPGTEFTVPCDYLITAISQFPDFEGVEELKNEKGWSTAEGNFGRISNDANVWAGGDITRGLGLVTEAFGDGRLAAEEIDAYLKGIDFEGPAKPNIVKAATMQLGFYPTAPRQEIDEIAAAERIKNFDGYINGYDATAILWEASRCMSCGSCFDCDTCWSVCGDSAINKLPKGQHYEFNWDKCIGCNKCAEMCPCSFIDMT